MCVCARARPACMCDLRLSSARGYVLEDSTEECVARALANRCSERASVLARRSKKTALPRLEQIPHHRQLGGSCIYCWFTFDYSSMTRCEAACSGVNSLQNTIRHFEGPFLFVDHKA